MDKLMLASLTDLLYYEMLGQYYGIILAIYQLRQLEGGDIKNCNRFRVGYYARWHIYFGTL